MSQKRIQDYGSPVVASSLKSLSGAITSQGVLYGFEFIKDASNRVRINPGACVTNQGVIIIESESKYITINLSSPADYTIYYSHADEDVSGGVIAVLTISAGLLTNDVISGCVLGYVRFPGGTTLDQTNFIQPPNLKIGSVIPTTYSASWLIPIKGTGYCVTYTYGASINITDGGISTFMPSITIIGDVTINSRIVQNIADTSSLLVGMIVSDAFAESTAGSFIPPNSTIMSIDSIHQITLSNAATNTASSINISVFAVKPMLYLNLLNSSALASGTSYLTFPFKVSDLPYALLEIIISTDIGAVVTPVFFDSGGIPFNLYPAGYQGQSSFLLKTVEIPRTAIQTPNTIVYLQLQIVLQATKSARVQALGLNTYNLPV